MIDSIPEELPMPSFLSRPRRMSINARRPRSEQLGAEKIVERVDRQQQQQQQQQQQATQNSFQSPVERTRTPNQKNARTLIFDPNNSGGGTSTGNSTRAGCTTSSSKNRGMSTRRRRPVATGLADINLQQRQEGQQHQPMVSLSWPAVYQLNPQRPPKVQQNWEHHQLKEKKQEEPTQDEATAVITSLQNSTSSSCESTDGCGGEGGGGGGKEEGRDDRKKAPPVLRNKRQRQMAFVAQKVSSGPIDIPLSPSASAPNEDACYDSKDRSRISRGSAIKRNVPVDYVDPFIGVRATTTTLLDTGDAIGNDARGGRAATEADAWYLCWSSNRPDLDDNLGSVHHGPPAHIIKWEQDALSHRRAQQLLQLESGSVSNRVYEEGSAGGGAPTTCRGAIVGDDDDPEDQAGRGASERMPSDQCGSMFEMEMDM